MNKISYDKITSHFYILGMQEAHNTSMRKTAASVKDVAKMLGRGSAYTLPTVGTVGGLGAGSRVGFDLGNLVAGAPLRAVLQKVENASANQELLETLLSMPGAFALAGMGIGAGTAAGAIGGGILGNKGGNVLKDKLLRRLA